MSREQSQITKGLGRPVWEFLLDPLTSEGPQGIGSMQRPLSVLFLPGRTKHSSTVHFSRLPGILILGSIVVRIPGFQCRGPGSISLVGEKEILKAA